MHPSPFAQFLTLLVFDALNKRFECLLLCRYKSYACTYKMHVNKKFVTTNLKPLYALLFRFIIFMVL